MNKQYLISLVTLEVLVFITAFLPSLSGLFFILYFIMIMGVTALLTGKAAKKTLKDLKYISSGVKLYEEGKETIAKIRERDYMLKRELGVQSKAMMLQLLASVIFMIIFFVPNLRNAIVYGIGDNFKALVGSAIGKELKEKLALFVGYQAIYLSFFLISILTTELTSKYLTRKGHKNLMVSSHYVVTDRGIIIDGRLPIRFPVDLSKLRVNAPRGFVELEIGEVTSSSPMGGRGASRVRLYASKPKELASIIKKCSQGNS
ncbi:MAG: hypothetical protein B6U69_03130 [Thermofilum sp. ex4484_15]|nr:MAG: hypothetical protein B6U69_03130 [Thermofilum sp. ex4484_15]